MNRRERRAGLAVARTTRNEWHPFERVDLDPHWRWQHAAQIAELVGTTGALVQCWRNNTYSVLVYSRRRARQQPVLHLAIRRHDSDEVRGWSDLQRIKNEIVGESFAALEIYPPEDEVMDQANMRHLFVLPLGEAAPFTIRGEWS